MQPLLHQLKFEIVTDRANVSRRHTSPSLTNTSFQDSFSHRITPGTAPSMQILEQGKKQKKRFVVGIFQPTKKVKMQQI